MAFPKSSPRDDAFSVVGSKLDSLEDALKCGNLLGIKPAVDELRTAVVAASTALTGAEAAAEAEAKAAEKAAEDKAKADKEKADKENSKPHAHAK
jgi:ribosomal protein L12E/L44/L45/RPP1/RPP2